MKVYKKDVKVIALTPIISILNIYKVSIYKLIFIKGIKNMIYKYELESKILLERP